MLLKFTRATLMGTLAMMAMLLAYGSGGLAVAEDKKDEKLPDIAEIMKKGHKKTDGYIDLIKAATKEGNWEDAQKYAKTLAHFGESLGKNKPPKGDEASWKKLSEKYATNTKAVLKGTEDKNKAAVTKGLGGINCGECHKVHK